jgi:hypothetical protein
MAVFKEVFMQPIGSMLRHTGLKVSRQSELLALRARKASSTFASETRSASRELASVVRAEADAWGKYVAQSFTPRALERTVLVNVSHALRTLDAGVQHRLHAAEGRKRRVKGKLNGASKPRSKRQARSLDAQN